LQGFILCILLAVILDRGFLFLFELFKLFLRICWFRYARYYRAIIVIAVSTTYQLKKQTALAESLEGLLSVDLTKNVLSFWYVRKV